MIVWLSQIAGFLGTLIVGAAAAEGKRWVTRGIMAAVAVAALITAFLSAKVVMHAAATAAFNLAWNVLGSSSLTATAVTWVYCVLPPTFDDALASVVAIIVVGGAIRLTKWVWELRMG